MKVDFSCCSLFYHNCTIASIFSYTCQYILIITESCSFRSITRSYQLVLYIKAADLAEWLDYPRHQKKSSIGSSMNGQNGRRRSGSGAFGDVNKKTEFLSKHTRGRRTHNGRSRRGEPTTTPRQSAPPPPCPGSNPP
jgi:hypothetical protein